MFDGIIRNSTNSYELLKVIDEKLVLNILWKKEKKILQYLQVLMVMTLLCFYPEIMKIKDVNVWK